MKKILKYQIKRKTVQWKHSCSMRTDRRRDRLTKLIVDYGNFTKASSKKLENLESNISYLTHIVSTGTVQCLGTLYSSEWQQHVEIRSLTLILRRSRTGKVWFYTSTSKKRAARPKLYTKSLTRDLKLMYSRLTLVRISIKL